jgi:putative endonuclease
MERQPCVYLLANGRNGTLYVGVTSNLVKRVYEHRNERIAGFTKRYGVHDLVWYEVHERMEAILRGKKTAQELVPRRKNQAYRTEQSSVERLTA